MIDYQDIRWYCPGCGKLIPKENVEMSGDAKSVYYSCDCNYAADFRIVAEDYISAKRHEVN